MDKLIADALDTYFTVVIDNGLNASTFTARVVASTRASLACAVVGGYCAFTGPLHGGAPGPTLDMLDEAAALRRHKPGRSLQTNLEINAALLLDAVGLAREAFMPVFALGRSAGWIAHAMEQQKSGRPIRPLSNYVGPQPTG